jgi:hypothetical protein
MFELAMKENPEVTELLDLLKTRDEFEDVAKLFERSLRPWDQYSEEERKWIVAKASSMIASRRS